MTEHHQWKAHRHKRILNTQTIKLALKQVIIDKVIMKLRSQKSRNSPRELDWREKLFQSGSHGTVEKYKVWCDESRDKNELYIVGWEAENQWKPKYSGSYQPCERFCFFFPQKNNKCYWRRVTSSHLTSS